MTQAVAGEEQVFAVDLLELCSLAFPLYHSFALVGQVVASNSVVMMVVAGPWRAVDFVECFCRHHGSFVEFVAVPLSQCPVVAWK